MENSLFNHLVIGGFYTKNSISDLLGENSLKSVREGIYTSTSTGSILLFVDLVKTGKEERFHFNDYFQEDYFHWDSQTTQHINSPRIQKIVQGDVEVNLFVRILPRIKSKVQPFTYCGRLNYVDHDPNTFKPVHIVFQSLDFDEKSDLLNLIEIYEWKPESIGGTSTNYFKFVPRGETKTREQKKPNYTERRGLVTSRVVQGYYRQEIIKKWDGKCSLTGCTLKDILISSHIKGWSECNDSERLDPDNGILLSPNVDSLFDKHLISFNDDGSMIMSERISENELQILGLNSTMVIYVSDGMRSYLKFHRNRLSEKNQ
jgi:hypothetical protein